MASRHQPLIYAGKTPYLYAGPGYSGRTVQLAIVPPFQPTRPPTSTDPVTLPPFTPTFCTTEVSARSPEQPDVVGTWPIDIQATDSVAEPFKQARERRRLAAQGNESGAAVPATGDRRIDISPQCIVGARPERGAALIDCLQLVHIIDQHVVIGRTAIHRHVDIIVEVVRLGVCVCRSCAIAARRIVVDVDVRGLDVSRR